MALGSCLPRAPTDPDVRDSGIWLVRSWVRCATGTPSRTRSAIRGSCGEMGSEFGVPGIVPSHGSMTRHPLPSPTSLVRASSPASTVVRGAPTPDPPPAALRCLRAPVPRRHSSFAPVGPRVVGPGAWAVQSGALPDPLARRQSGLPGSWGTLACACPALRPRRARQTWPCCGMPTRPSV